MPSTVSTGLEVGGLGAAAGLGAGAAGVAAGVGLGAATGLSLGLGAAAGVGLGEATGLGAAGAFFATAVTSSSPAVPLSAGAFALLRLAGRVAWDSHCQWWLEGHRSWARLEFAETNLPESLFPPPSKLPWACRQRPLSKGLQTAGRTGPWCGCGNPMCSSQPRAVKVCVAQRFSSSRLRQVRTKRFEVGGSLTPARHAK